MQKIKLFLLLILCVLTFTANSETLTTGNLLPNKNDGVDWNSSSTDMINDGSSGYVTNGSVVNGFTINCTNQTNCGYKYDVGGDFEVTGTATVSVDDIPLTSNSITQPMLDNGVTLNSYIDVANCESVEGNCEAKSGSNDSHTTTVKLKDINGNTLSTVSQTRTEQVGFQGNCNGYPGASGDGRSAACGQYTDTIIYNDVGSNKVDWSWTGTDTNYTNQSIQGVNLLGAALTMTYSNKEYNPIDVTIQNELNTIEEIELDEFVFEEEINLEEIEIVQAFETAAVEELFEEEFFEEDFEIIEEEFAESEIEEFTEEAVEEEVVEKEVVEDAAEEPTEEVAQEEELEEEKLEEVVEEEITEDNQDVEVAEQKNKIEIQVSDNIKVEVKEVSLFENNLDEYENVPFYKNTDIYTNVDNGFFIQADLSIYNKPFYVNMTLDNYVSSDVLGMKERKLYDLRVQKMELVIELQRLKELL